MFDTTAIFGKIERFTTMGKQYHKAYDYAQIIEEDDSSSCFSFFSPPYFISLKRDWTTPSWMTSPKNISAGRTHIPRSPYKV